MPNPITLAEFIDRKRRLEVEVAVACEKLIARFEQDTGAKVTRATVVTITRNLSSATVEVRL